jgi:DNA repair protein RecO (recombination protein O)
MSVDRINAILLRRIRFSETSLILTWFGRETGKIKAIAKGALRPGSAFAGKIDLFFRCDLTISRSQKSEIHTLRELVVLEAFLNIRTNYLTTLTASYFTELVEEATEPEHAEPEIYDLLRRGLTYLEGERPTLRAIVFFEAELARLLGIQMTKQSDSSRQLIESLTRAPTARMTLIKQLGSD